MYEVDEHRFSPDGLTEELIDALMSAIDDELSNWPQPPRLVPVPELDERRERRQARRVLALIAGAGHSGIAPAPVAAQLGGEAA
jgi:hypothetical protein